MDNSYGHGRAGLGHYMADLAKSPTIRARKSKIMKKKQPQRGLGVAQLEKLRLIEEQTKQGRATELVAMRETLMHGEVGMKRQPLLQSFIQGGASLASSSSSFSSSTLQPSKALQRLLFTSSQGSLNHEKQGFIHDNIVYGSDFRYHNMSMMGSSTYPFKKAKELSSFQTSLTNQDAKVETVHIKRRPCSIVQEPSCSFCSDKASPMLSIDEHLRQSNTADCPKDVIRLDMEISKVGDFLKLGLSTLDPQTPYNISNNMVQATSEEFQYINDHASPSSRLNQSPPLPTIASAKNEKTWWNSMDKKPQIDLTLRL